MQRQATKSKLKREKIKIESEMAATTTDDVLSTIAAAKTITCGSICVLCRQEMLLDSCCCRQAVEANNMSGSSVETNRSSSINKISSESSASGNDIVINNNAARNSCFILKKNTLRLATIPTGFERFCKTKVESTGKKRGLKCSGNRTSEENDEGSLKNNRQQREKFNIFSNCHNILRTLQSLLLLMFNCGIFNKRRRRQQQQPKNVIYTKFLLLLQTLSAATTRLSLNPNNYNQQQQLKHNQQLSSATPHHQQKQQPDKQKRFLHLRHYHPWNSSLIWILAVNLLIIHGTGSVALQQQPQHLPQNNITDKLNALSVSTLSRPPRSQQNEAMQLAQNVTPCKSIDIRNLASQFSQLENCTVIEGFLLINLINDASPLNKSFPRLTEVTEFVVVYRVSGLHSLSKVFPNLSVIRGLYLFDAYALVVYSNLDLTDLGLSKLRSITRGGVRIEKNQKLCFADTIHWKHIMGEGNLTESQVVILGNAKPEDCKDTKCPGKVRIGEDQYSTALSGELSASCRALSPNQTRYCWDSKICQTICPTNCRDNCFDEHTCCHKDCLGGCIRDKNGNQRCIGCRNVSFNNICLESCPKDFYQYDSRCVTAEECIKLKKFESGKEMALVPYRGQCTKRCPKTYKMENNTCVPCPGGKCEKECTSGLIDSLERARVFHGCTIITGDDPLVISIKRDSKAHVMDELESSLSAVHKIQSSLMVHLTYGLTSLKFFKSLTEISGNMSGENKFALYVLENRDLEEIWSPNQTVFIRNGGVFFHFNPKLCVSTINKLLPMLASKPTYFDKRDVATDSNGNRGSCETAALNVTVKTLSSKFAVVMVSSKVEIGDPLKPSNATVIFKDSRAFIGFVFYHMIDPYKNATKSNDDPCDDTWKVSSPEKSGSAILGDLTPYTWYAYYVRTMAISSERTNAESKVEHFMTNADQPSKVTDVVATATSDSKINVTWSYREAPNGKLSRFFIKAKLISRPSRNLNRDYCDEPLAKAMDNELPATTPTKKIPDILSGDCKCAEGSKKTIKKDFDDRTLHTGMEFENTLQNFIFVPKKRENKKELTGNKDAAEGGALDSNAIPNGGAKNSSRPRRDIALEPELNNMYGSVLLRHVRSITDNPDVNLEKGDEKTYKDEERLSTNGKFFEVFGKELPPNQTSFVFENLRHFTRYSIFVVACREETANDEGKGPFCSEYESVFPTTKKKENADNILDVQVPKFANNTKSSVRISWAPPADPNGEILTYEVAYKLQKPDQVEEKKCIPVEDFNQTVGYYLKLNEGKYSIRVRANSLAGYGNFTNARYTEVEAPLNYTKYFLWLSGIVGILLIVGLTGYVRHLRKEVPLNDFHINTEVNPFYASMQYIPDDWEVMRENIIQLAPLGQGSFGMVYNGILKSFSGNGVDRECAIKTVNENATDRERTNFLSEASVMKEFDTHHVVRLLGVCSRGQPALVVMELMKKGDLKSYLRAHRPEERDAAMMAYLHRIGVTGNVQPPTYGRIYQMAIEIADGMAYLAAKKFVHRDLAARNCMVAEDLTVKIGDFGMTRDIYETDYYRKGTKGLLPVRWMPPESLRDGVYSSASDVFSFGVVLWEMATLAAQPYQGYTNEQVLRLVIDGGVMERPENCPKVLDRLMEKCWRHRPSARPSFLDIIAYLEQQCPDSNFKDVSFYHSEMGLHHREKERKERSQLDAFAAVPLDQDQQDAGQQEDATTPLRTEQNSSLDQPAESPVALVDDHATHSPFSLQSGFIVSSTPDNQTAVPTAFQNLTRQSDDAAAYVQPDPATLVEEKGYETYDPSPKCVELPTSRSGSTGGGGKLSGEQHLLPRKGRQPIIMSNSMPDDVIGGSSLQPSTASVASSNASSQTGRYLKRVVADTLRNPANMINRHLFNHKRTGSNASHKSNASNAPSTSSNSNLTSHPVAMGNLGTIESGGSGSAGSFTGTPRFYTPSAAPSGGGVAISDNPNYRILDESVASEQATILTTSSPNPNYEIMHPSGSQISANPNYVPMKKSPVQMAGVTISQNPNYQPMQAPLNARQSSSEEDNEQEEDDEDDDEDVDDEHVEHIKMERMPLSRPRQKAVLRLEPPRSRSASKTRKSPTNPNAGVGTTGVGNMSNLLKESWLRPASTPRPPPPNGFIGREA